MLIAKVMRLAHARGELFIVLAQLGKHIQRGDEVRVVVLYALQAGDLANRPHCRAAQLANTFGYWVSCRENLIAVLIQQQMIIPEMWT